jgi:hypothetical protein
MYVVAPSRKAFPEAPSDNESEANRASAKLKFSPEEDALLMRIIREHGAKDWVKVASFMRTRNPRQCRERYKNYLNPDLRRGDWTLEEDRLLELKHQECGAKWNKIGRFFVNRSDISLRNRWMILARRQAKEEGPPELKRHIPAPPVVLPIMAPITKELPATQTRLIEESSEMFAPPQFPFSWNDAFPDLWANF